MENLLQIDTEKTTFVLIGKETKNSKRLALHPVINGVIDAEVPFDEETAKSIFSLFNTYKHQYKTFSGIIPKNILIAKDDIESGLELMFFVEKKERNLFFKNDAFFDGVYKLPTILFHYKQNKLFVYAIADTKSIDENTELFHTPFLNVYNNNSVCMGNVNLSKLKNLISFESCINLIELAFFNSFFTHSNNDNIDFVSYLNTLNTTKSYTNQNLISTYKTIKNLL